MLGIDLELEELYKKAQQEGRAVIKDHWVAGNYGCCSTRAPLVEKYKIEFTETKISLYIWGKLAVSTNPKNDIAVLNTDHKVSNYDKKIIDWFTQRSQKA